MSRLIKIVFDKDNYDYGFAMGGDKDKVYSPSIPYDANFKAKGYDKYLVVNGSLFFWYMDENNKKIYDALGIEVIEGKNLQNVYVDTTAKYNDDMACIVKDNKLIFARQGDIIWDVDAEKCYCGLTGIGIMLNGEQFPVTKTFTSQYKTISGRTLIGTDKEGNFLSYSVKGETGKSGLYGKELFKIAQDNGFYNCLCLDGGGSCYRFFNGKTDISTTRAIKNTFIIYRKKKACSTPIEKPVEKPVEKPTKPEQPNDKLNIIVILLISIIKKLKNLWKK